MWGPRKVDDFSLTGFLGNYQFSLLHSWRLLAYGDNFSKARHSSVVRPNTQNGPTIIKSLTWFFYIKTSRLSPVLKLRMEFLQNENDRLTRILSLLFSSSRFVPSAKTNFWTNDRLVHNYRIKTEL